MSTLTHNVKKRLSLATTRSKKLETRLPTDYLAAKTRLKNERKGLEEGVKLLDASWARWEEMGRFHKDMAELIESEASIDGGLHVEAGSNVTAVRAMHQQFVGMGHGEVVSKLKANVSVVVKEMESIEGQFKTVEGDFNETLRYERKVDKLAGKEKKSDKVTANKGKLEAARKTYEASLDGVIKRMTAVNGMYDGMLQSLQTAFWVTQDQALALVMEKTAGPRDNAKMVVDEVAKMDAASGETPVVVKEGDAVAPAEAESKAEGDEGETA
eukprot:GFKZ01007228.1.p1 GENE.GFKZ01007228.1~~GFKZ01007228.1.p1  ORF type:complete len:270 (+),score=63.35 GFKZ01007228.1:478-1287(+)